MDRQSVYGLTITALLCTGVAFCGSHAQAQQKALKDQLVGTWSLVSNENVAPDGAKRQPFGANPKGILILDANGRYAQVFTHPDRPKFKANNRLQGTPEEIRAAWDGPSHTLGHGLSLRQTKQLSSAWKAHFIQIKWGMMIGGSSAM